MRTFYTAALLGLNALQKAAGFIEDQCVKVVDALRKGNKIAGRRAVQGLGSRALDVGLQLPIIPKRIQTSSPDQHILDLPANGFDFPRPCDL